MVEITASLILQIVQTIALIVGIVYYLTIMRNQQKTRELALKAQEHATETRQTQIFTELFNRMQSPEAWDRFQEVSAMWTWTDFDDFWEKYGEENAPESWNKFINTVSPFEYMALLVRDGMINAELVWHWWGLFLIDFWEKILPVVDGYRERFFDDSFLEWFEDLYYSFLDLREKEKPLFEERVAKRKQHRATLNI